MKVTPRFMVRAALVLTASGVIGAFGACKDSTEPPPPVPPPPAVAAPSGLTATATSGTRVDLAWTDNATNETGFKVERCSGAGCTNFAQIGVNTAADVVAFVDTFGIAAATPYNYRVAAFNATATSGFAIATMTIAAPTSFTLLTTGEISTCQSLAGPEATAAIIAGIMTSDTSAVAVTTGNNLAGTGGTYETCFNDKGWGDIKSKVRFAIGNGDFDGRDAATVYGYFGDRTGPAGKGWFSFDKGSWHIVVLNTSDRQHGVGPTFGVVDGDPAPDVLSEEQVPSEQVDWLTADLAANTKPCVAVISWERRFYTSGNGALGKAFNMVRLGGIMRDHGVDLLISAKDKLYSRFAPADLRSGAPDPAGFRQFIVGTGGRDFDNPGAPAVPAIREALIDHQWGVLKLTLAENSYSWEFINTAAGGPTDKSDAAVACH